MSKKGNGTRFDIQFFQQISTNVETSETNTSVEELKADGLLLCKAHKLNKK